MQSSLRFIESFDSVRYALNVPQERRDSVTLAQYEVLLGMLFGNRFAVSEPYNFDSLGFMNIANQVLAKRESAKDNPPPNWNLFHIPLRHREGKDSFLGMVSAYFNRGPVGPSALVLSGWEGLNGKGDGEKRNELANLFLSQKYEEARRLSPENATAIELIKNLNEYYSTEETTFPAGAPQHVMNWFLGEECLGRLERDPRGLTERQIKFIGELREATHELKVSGIDITLRSLLRTEGLPIIGPEKLDLTIQFTDTCYNIILSEAAKAEVSSFTTSGSSHTEAVLAGEALALVSGDISPKTNRMALWSPVHARNLNEVVQLPSFSDYHVQNAIWEQAWSIMATPEWRHSYNDLQSSLTEKEPQINKIRDGIQAHVEQINSAFKKNSLLRTREGDDLRLKMISRGTNVYVAFTVNGKVGEVCYQPFDPGILGVEERLILSATDLYKALEEEPADALEEAAVGKIDHEGGAE